MFKKEMKTIIISYKNKMANKQVIKYTYLLLTILTRQFSHQPPTGQHFMNTNQRLSTHHLPNGPNPKVNLSPPLRTVARKNAFHLNFHPTKGRQFCAQSTNATSHAIRKPDTNTEWIWVKLKTAHAQHRKPPGDRHWWFKVLHAHMYTLQVY